jgi:hypothetical protein
MYFDLSIFQRKSICRLCEHCGDITVPNPLCIRGVTDGTPNFVTGAIDLDVSKCQPCYYLNSEGQCKDYIPKANPNTFRGM